MPTDEEYQRFRRAVIKKLNRLEKKIDDVLGEVWEKVAANHDAEAEIADEALEKAERAQRAVRRLQKEFNEHEHEE